MVDCGVKTRTHRDIARCVSEEVRVFAGTAVKVALERGSTYPDPSARDTGRVPAGITFPTPHHRWIKGSVSRVRTDVVPACVKQARRDYLHRRYHDAGFRLGVALHYTAHDLVPWRGDDPDHGQFEADAG